MKKQLLVTLTLLFAAFTLGFFLGRNQRKTEVTVSVSKTLYTLPPAAESVPETTETIRYPLDLNRATAQELQTLPGIGQVLAQRILDYREEHGPFTSEDQLMDVYGIGEMLYESIQDYVTVLNEGSSPPL